MTAKKLAISAKIFAIAISIDVLAATAIFSRAAISVRASSNMAIDSLNGSLSKL